MEQIEISKIKPNPKNPRVISEVKLDKLTTSIQELSAMLQLRPIVVDEKMVILGGNQRLKACINAGMEKVPYVVFTKAMANEMNKQAKAEKRKTKTYKQYCDEFVIKDNANAGDWDWEMLNAEWNVQEVQSWGVEVLEFGNLESLPQVNSENDEWVDMPEFEKKDDTLKIIIHFDSEEDREEFSKKYKMNFIKKQSVSWSTHYPFKEREDLSSVEYSEVE